MRLPETVEVETGEAPDASVIWLHGLGADGHDFEPIVPQLGLGPGFRLRFVFPHAPVRPVTVNGGAAMRAWYDIFSFDRSAPQDEAGILDSVATLESLVARERGRGVALRRIVLAGFSQGGSVALHTALRYGERLGGVIGLSTWLPPGPRLEADRAGNEAARGLPAFLAHGSHDPVLPPALGEDARRQLQAAGLEVTWREYPMPHAVCPEEIAAIAAWLGDVLG